MTAGRDLVGSCSDFAASISISEALLGAARPDPIVLRNERPEEVRPFAFFPWSREEMSMLMNQTVFNGEKRASLKVCIRQYQ